MELEPVPVTVLAQTGKGRIVNPCPIPGDGIGIENIAQYRTHHPGVRNHQYMVTTAVGQDIFQCLRNPPPKVLQCFRTRWPIMAGITIECFIFLPVPTDDLIRAKTLPATEADLM